MTNLFFLFIFVPILSFILLALNILLAPHKPDESKVSVYECGFEAIRGQTRSTFQIQFMVVALLFLIFDLELILLFPIAVTLYKVSIFGFSIAILFFIILTIGFILEIGSGAIHLANLDLSIKNSEKSSGRTRISQHLHWQPIKFNFNKNLKTNFFTFNNSSCASVGYKFGLLRTKGEAQLLKIISFFKLYPLIRILKILSIVFFIFILIYLFYNYNLIFNSSLLAQVLACNRRLLAQPTPSDIFYSLYLSKLYNALLHNYQAVESITVFKIKIFFIIVLICVNFFFFFLDAKKKGEIIKYDSVRRSGEATPVLESGFKFNKVIKESWKYLLGSAAIYNVYLANKNDDRAEILFREALKKEATEKNITELVNKLNSFQEERTKEIAFKALVSDHSENVDKVIKKVRKNMTILQELRIKNDSDINTNDIEVAKTFLDFETLELIHNRFMNENPDIKAKIENNLSICIPESSEASKTITTPVVAFGHYRPASETNLLETIEGAEIKKSFMFSGIWESLLDKYETLDTIGKLAIGLLILKSTLLSALISIIFIYYGDHLINKYNIENRFPKLAEIIKLRRKFSTYYLFWNVSLILGVISVESLFSIAVIFDL